VKIRVSGRARRRIRAQDEWWRKHRRDAPDLFKKELTKAFERILLAPKVRQPYGHIEDEPVWRILMPETEQHIYYTVGDNAAEVVIETLWGARRKRGPKL
jgi:hypothetical protein